MSRVAVNDRLAPGSSATPAPRSTVILLPGRLADGLSVRDAENARFTGLRSTS